jgi:glycosyltransferase involved in cell wall biosynthesis
MKRPVVAIVSNVQTPYRVAMHRRLIRGIPEVEFYSVYTHDVADQKWSADIAADTNPVRFGAGDSSDDQVSLGAQRREFVKGGKIIEWMKQVGVTAVMIGGYSDLGRVRIMVHSHNNNIPVFLMSDSNIYSERFGGWRKAVKKMLLGELSKTFSRVLVGGENGRKFYRQYGVEESRFLNFGIEVDYGTIDSITPEQVQDVAQRLGLQSGRKRMVFCGRMEKVKRPDLMIQAFAAIADEAPDWDLVMIGGGSLLKSTQAMVPDRLKHRVFWLGFIDDPRIIFSVYRLCGALILPSAREPWGLVVNEAAASGLAIVCSDRVGSAPELVRPGINGFQFKTNDLASLTDALRQLVVPGLCERLAGQSKGIVAEFRAAYNPVPAVRTALKQFGQL